MMAATIAVQSHRYEPSEPGPSIIDIEFMTSAVAVQPASVSAASAAGRRSVRATFTRSWLAGGTGCKRFRLRPVVHLMTVAFSIRDTTATGRSFVLTVTGDLDRATAQSLEERLRQGPGELAENLVLDLTHVQDVDDTCIRLVAKRSVEATAGGQQL